MQDRWTCSNGRQRMQPGGRHGSRSESRTRRQSGIWRPRSNRGTAACQPHCSAKRAQQQVSKRTSWIVPQNLTSPVPCEPRVCLQVWRQQTCRLPPAKGLARPAKALPARPFSRLKHPSEHRHAMTKQPLRQQRLTRTRCLHKHSVQPTESRREVGLIAVAYNMVAGVGRPFVVCSCFSMTFA